jgi:hypothetical protein
MSNETAVATLRRAMNAQTLNHRLDPGVAGTAWSDAHATQRHRVRTGLAVAASLVAVAGVTAALALSRDDTATPPGASSACTGNVSTAVLPTWAQTGFSSDGLHTPHVFGAHDAIVGILFGQLRAHQPAGINNKILWVAQDGGGPLRITAQLERSHTTATRTVDLGPSIVDLPAAGCWRMTLTWSGHRDTIALLYH